MKNILRLIILLALIQLGACSDDGDGNTQTKMLTKEPWAHAQVTHSDGDLSNQYTNFVIVFTNNPSGGFNGTYIISNGGYAFSETSGMWKFNNDKSKIILDSGKEMDFVLDNEHLELDFVVAAPGGKVAGLSGHFAFSLQPL